MPCDAMTVTTHAKHILVVAGKTQDCAYNVSYDPLLTHHRKRHTMIRKATQDDMPTLAQFITSFVESGDVLPRTLDELTDLIDTCFVVELDGAIVGTAILEIYSPKLAEIRSLCVAPAVQGKGHGKALIEACVGLARDRNVTEVMAITRSETVFMKSGFDYTLPNLRKALFLNIPQHDARDDAQSDDS